MEVDLKKAWEDYHNGNHVDTETMRKMVEQTKAALPYLESRGEKFYIATYVTRQNLLQLEGYLRARAHGL